MQPSEYHKIWAKANRDYLNGYYRNWRAKRKRTNKDREYNRIYIRQYRHLLSDDEEFLEKESARHKVYYAVKTGKLKNMYFYCELEFI